MASHRRVVRFGPFDADLLTGELRKNGQRLPIQRQPFQLLAALLERKGDLVTQQELRCRLWPDGTQVSFERGLASALRKLREALGDTAKAPLYVETLQRRGYRFIAPVSAPVAAPTRPPAALSSSTLRWVAVVLLSILIGGQGRFPAGTDDRLLAAEALSDYACLLKSRGDLAGALRVIRQAQALVPDSAKITAEVGFYLHAAGRYDEEFPTLQRAAELDDRSPDVWLHFGLAYARRQQFAKAVESLEHARQLAGADVPLGGMNRPVGYWLDWARDQRVRATAGS